MHSEPQPVPVKKGKELELEITAATYERKGLGRTGNYAIFVKHTAPGDLVRVRVNRKRKQYAEAQLLELIRPSEERIAPVCRHAGTCGGCSWQHVAYEKELQWKADQVRDHFHRIGGLSDVMPLAPLGAEPALQYRNKMEFSFGDRRWLTAREIEQNEHIKDREFALGLHLPGRFDRILHLEQCHLMPLSCFEIVRFTGERARAAGLTAYNNRQHEGLLRNLVIRASVHTSDLMVNLVTNTDANGAADRLLEDLHKKFPHITTLIHTVNNTRSPSSDNAPRRVLHGPGYISERLGNYHFRIDPDTFFQTNTRQAERLYELVRDAVGNEPVNTLYDLYCGVGTLTLFAGEKAARVAGIELHAGSVEKARQNAADNNVNHAFFEQGDARDLFNDAFTARHGHPDVLITDPPRAGMHEQVIEQLLQLKPRRIIYVSCNSATQARDVAMLSETYHINSVQPVDMFPRTYHMESVCVLTLRDDC